MVAPTGAEWANNLAKRILGLASAYVVINTDDDTRVDTPYLTVLSQIQDDDQLANMCITAGDPLSSAHSAAFLRACKHFLDLMTITTYHSSEQYEYRGYSPYLFKYDYWRAQSNTPAFDDYDPYYAGSWAAHFAACVSRKVVEFDNELTFIGCVFRGYRTNGYLSAPVNIRYQSRTTLAHKLIIRFEGRTSDPPSEYSEWQFDRPWDWLGLGLAHGDLYTVLAPEGGGEVAIGGDTALAPEDTPNYAPWDGTPPEPDPTPPYYGNVFFRGSFNSFAFDYGVEGGFSFRI